MTSPTLVSVPYLDLLPESWRTLPGLKVWQSLYRIVDLNPSTLPSPVTIDLVDLRATLLNGTLPYFSSTTVEDAATDIPVAIRVAVGMKTTPLAPWLAFFARYDPANPALAEPAVKARIQEARGLIVALMGRNIAHASLADNIVDPGTGQFSGFSTVVANPYVLPSPRLDREVVESVREAYANLSSLPSPESARVSLSLRWYAASLQDHGTDAYLKCWIALEVLAMPDTTDIAPLKALLGSAYSVSPAEASSTFLLGHLAALRGRIVHTGTITSLHYAIPLFLEALYRDALGARLFLRPEAYAANLLARTELNIPALLRSLLYESSSL